MVANGTPEAALDAVISAIDSMSTGTEVEGIERSENLEKDVLREIFCDVVFSHELVRDVEHFPPMLFDNQLPRHLITTQTALDQCFEGG